MEIFARILLLVLCSWIILGTNVLAGPIAPKRSNEEHVDIRLPTNTAPFHYNIELVPYIDGNFTFDGETSTDFHVLNSTASVVLHVYNLTIDENFTNVIDKNGAILVPREHIYNNETEFLILSFAEPLEPDVYTLRLKFQGYINDLFFAGFYRSFYTNDEGEKVWLATTHFEPTSARMAFPCWDEPALKATFNISVKHYGNYTVLSNMPAYELSEVDSDGRMWTRFETTPRMSTYLVVFVVQNFAKVSNDAGTINVWSRSNALNSTKLMHEYAEKCEAELTRYMNSTVRVPKMDHIAIPQYSSRATEHWGAITYIESDFLYDEEKEGALQKLLTVMLVAHELVHQWFGNVVTPAWWNDLWLSEAFAAYYQSYIVDKINGEWRLEENYMNTMVFSTLFTMDAKAQVYVVRPNITTTIGIRRVFNFITYRKGATLVRMMSHILTEEVFHKGIVEYVNSHEYGSATSADLFAALQNTLDESNMPHGGFNLSEVMLPWIEQVNYPLVTVTRNYSTGEMTITQVTIRSTRWNDPSEENYQPKWWVPLNFATKSNPDFSKTYATHWLKPTDESITISGINSDDWVIFNIQNMGYYRVNYDVTNWRKIAKLLNSDDFTKIPPLNRASVLYNVYYVMLEGGISPLVFLEITNYLSREDDFIAWQAALNILDDLYNYSPILESDSFLRVHLLGLMRRVIEKIGYDDVSGESDLNKILREKLRVHGCRLGDLQCIESAASHLRNVLENPQARKAPFNKQEWIYCTGVSKADEEFWNRVYDLYVTTQDEMIASCLACVENTTILENYLNLTLSDSSPIPAEEKSGVYMQMISGNKKNLDFAIDYLANNSAEIFDTIPYLGNIVDTLLSAATKESQLEKIKELQRLIGEEGNTRGALERIQKGERLLKKLNEWFQTLNGEEQGVDNALK